MSRTNRLVVLVPCLLLSIIVVSVRGKAGVLDDLKKTAGDVVETGWRAATAPYEAVVNAGKVITGSAEPKAIIRPYQEIGRSAGSTFQGATSLASNPQREIYRRVQEFASRSGGDVGEFVFDVGTFNQRFYNELASAGGFALANALRGQNPLQMTAVPLAGAIRAAREKHAPNAKPLPEDVRRGLAKHFSKATLDRAKFVVGSVDITLPNFIGRGARFMGNDYAVVVDDIVVFNTNPPPYGSAPFWWVHEVTHVEQYQRWGIESFAFRYIRDLGSTIEGEADNKAAIATGDSQLAGAAILAADAHQLGMVTASMPAVREGRIRQPVPEFFVAQCFFPGDPFPVNYLLTNTRKIIAVNPFTGNWLHIGWATPPLAPGVAWTYQTTHLRYAVFPNGGIFTVNQFGQYIQIGHVVRLR